MKEPNRRKISVAQVKLSDQETGFTFGGVFVGVTEGATFQKMDEETGEIREGKLAFAVFEDKETKARTAFVADKGLTGALAESGVKPGEWIECVKLEKIKLKGAKTMNQYDIFQLS